MARRDRYVQVFATKFCWVPVFPMQKKSDAHEGLYLLAAQESIPAAIVVDNAREQTMENFRKMARKWGVISSTQKLTHLGKMWLRAIPENLNKVQAEK